MIESYLFNHLWIPILIWTLLYIGDYYLTIIGARLLKLQQIYEYEGGYELNSKYIKDINEMRLISFTLIKWLIIINLILLFSAYTNLSFFGMVIGGFIFPEIVVYMRHIDNIIYFLFFKKQDPDALGHLKINRRHAYWDSGYQMACFAFFSFITFFLTNNAILFGAGLGLTYITFAHLSMAYKLKARGEGDRHNAVRN